MRNIGSGIFLGAFAIFATCEVESASNGVVFMYHHVDDGTPPSTSVTPEFFDEQLLFLEREGFTVLPLLEMLESIAAGRDLAARSVAITVDDGYRSILTEVLPRLEARGWPFTVFISTEAIDNGYRGYLTWNELREIGQRGGTIGNHSVSHAHLTRRVDGESVAAWQQRIATEISAAESRLDAEVGRFRIPVFAYPYGEYTVALKAIVADQGLYAVGQHSGAIGTGSDFLALPRYPVATGIDLDEFALRARSLPLPLGYAESERHVVDEPDGRPGLVLRIDGSSNIRLDELACYASGQGQVPLEWRDAATSEFSIRPDSPLGAGRSKINCTAPSAMEPGVYYWWGHLWMRRQSNGAWYDE